MRQILLPGIHYSETDRQLAQKRTEIVLGSFVPCAAMTLPDARRLHHDTNLSGSSAMNTNELLPLEPEMIPDSSFWLALLGRCFSQISREKQTEDNATLIIHPSCSKSTFRAILGRTKIH